MAPRLAVVLCCPDLLVLQYACCSVLQRLVCMHGAFCTEREGWCLLSRLLPRLLSLMLSFLAA